MLNKKWMILSLLIGNIFLISIAMSGPMYIDAVTQNLLTRTLTDSYRETGVYPALYTMESTAPKGEKDSIGYTEYMQAKSDIQALPEMVGTAALYETEFTWTEDYTGKTTSDREDNSTSVNLYVSMMTGLEEHMELISGEGLSAEPDEEGVYNALISRTAFVRKRLLIGVYRDKLNVAKSAVNHSVYGIGSGSADTNNLNRCKIRSLKFEFQHKASPSLMIVILLSSAKQTAEAVCQASGERFFIRQALFNGSKNQIHKSHRA